MIDVYILLSNEFSFLDFQVGLIKKYVKDLGSIYGVMGPIGQLGAFKKNLAKSLTINEIIIPPEKRFISVKPIKLYNIVDYLMDSYVDKSGNTALILHADVFPISNFEMPPNLNIIGRGSNNKSNFSLTWLAINPTYRLVDYKLDSSYSSFFPMEDKFEKTFGIKKEDDINIEWCNPCFIHTDDSSKNADNNPELVSKKLKFLEKYISLKENLVFDESVILPQDLISLTKRYTKEREVWVNAGKPLRSPEEIERIFTICSACPFFFAKSSASGSCSICGCQIKKRGKLMNKAAWATTECPKTPSEWLPNQNPEIFTKKDLPIKKCCGKS